MANNNQPGTKFPTPKLEDSPSFHLFPKLPTELRLMIWNETLERRLLNVRIVVDSHARTGIFNTQSDGTGKSACIKNGGFEVHDYFTHGPEGYTARESLHNISLTCRESRGVVLSRYPETMKVRRRAWYGKICRSVRCNPATDLLIIRHVTPPGYSSSHQDYALGKDLWLPRNLPTDPNEFFSFRKIVSSFQHVAFTYHGSREVDWVKEDPDLHFGGPFALMLMYFESMKSLYMYLHPHTWPEAQNGVRVENLHEYLSSKENSKPSEDDLPTAASSILQTVNKKIEFYREDFVECKQHWAPKLKRIEEIGCWSAHPGWLQKKTAATT